jgi:hypothetical protein
VTVSRNTQLAAFACAGIGSGQNSAWQIIYCLQLKMPIAHGESDELQKPYVKYMKAALLL